MDDGAEWKIWSEIRPKIAALVVAVAAPRHALSTFGTQVTRIWITNRIQNGE